MISEDKRVRPYLTLRCQLSCSYCSNRHKPNWSEDDELGVAAWLKRIEKFDCEEIVVTGGEPTLHRDFRAIVRGWVEMGKTVHVYTNLEAPIPDDMADLSRAVRWRVSCHSQTAEAAQRWLQRMGRAHRQQFRLSVTTVHCPESVMAVLREHSIVLDPPQTLPQAAPPPVRCTITSRLLAPDCVRYHCVGKLVLRDTSGAVPSGDGNTVICQTPDCCALCDSITATRILMP